MTGAAWRCVAEGFGEPDGDAEPRRAKRARRSSGPGDADGEGLICGGSVVESEEDLEGVTEDFLSAFRRARRASSVGGGEGIGRKGSCGGARDIGRVAAAVGTVEKLCAVWSVAAAAAGSWCLGRLVRAERAEVCGAGAGAWEELSLVGPLEGFLSCTLCSQRRSQRPPLATMDNWIR